MADVEENFETYEEQPVVEAAIEPEAEGLTYGTTTEIPEIKLFGRWSCDDVHVSDMSLAVSVTYQVNPYTHIYTNTMLLNKNDK